MSFTFDDFPRTAYTAGGAILEAFGARGTYYAAAALMNTSGELGDHFTPNDLSVLLRHGHELGNHTFSHCSCRSLPVRVFCADVEKGKQSLEKLTGHAVHNFSYPFGHITIRTKKRLGSAAGSARGICAGFNGPEIDLNLLRANRVYGDLDQAPRLSTLIQENARRKSWLIFYTHDVRSDPSPYGCTPSLLEATVSCAVRNGCRILTVQQVLTEVGVQNGNPKGQVPCEGVV